MRTNIIGNNQPAFGKVNVHVSNNGRTGLFEEYVNLEKRILTILNRKTGRRSKSDYYYAKAVPKNPRVCSYYETELRDKEPILSVVISLGRFKRNGSPNIKGDADIATMIKKWAQRKGIKASVFHIKKDGYNNKKS